MASNESTQTSGRALAPIEQTGKTLNVSILSVLGGPGAGKGTQCKRLSDAFRLEHLSIGDVLREEMNNEDSPYKDIIKENMLAGRVGPKEITVEVLKRHIEQSMRQGIRAFVLDGFPRNMEQCHYFENTIAPILKVIVFDCSKRTMVNRLTARGRFDDSEENIQRRLDTFEASTSVVIEAFERADKVVHVNGEQDVDGISAQLQEIIKKIALDRGIDL